MPPQVIVSSILSICNIDNAEREALRKRYTFTPIVPKGTPRHVRPLSVSLCTTYKQFFNVPRDLALLQEWQQEGGNVHIMDAQDIVNNNGSARPPVQFLGELDPARNQPEAVAQCLAQLRSSAFGGGCLLSLPPGFGKTACALYISAHIARRTLILVHTSVLAQQWKERVETFLTNANVKIVGSQSIPTDIQEATHIIVLLQTVVALTKRGELSWLQNLHDLIIADECHHVCARTLCKVVETVGCRYRLGLSATVERKDGLDKMLACLLGPMAYRCERHDHPNLTVHAIKYACSTEILCAPTFVANVNEMTRDPRRQAMLLQRMIELYEQGRYIIVLSDRLQQLRDFETALSPNIPTHMAIGGNLEAPDMSLRPVLLATYQFASEGLDIPLLNTCIMASPRVDVKQSVGRILRSSGGDPLVLDVIDEDRAIMTRQFKKREQFYTKPLEDGGLQAIVILS
jgi:superfamily II DNA or RNA helicase